MKQHEYIKKVRLEAKRTQEYVASKLYISKSTYSQYETGKRSLEVEMYQKILTILGVTTVNISSSSVEEVNFFDTVFCSLKTIIMPYPFNDLLLVRMATIMGNEIEDYSLDEGVVHQLVPYFWQSSKDDHRFEVGFLLGDTEHPIGFNQHGEEIGHGNWIETAIVERSAGGAKGQDDFKRIKEQLKKWVEQSIRQPYYSDNRIKRLANFFCNMNLPDYRPDTNESNDELLNRLKSELEEKMNQKGLIKGLSEEVLNCVGTYYVVFKVEMDKNIIQQHNGHVFSEGYGVFSANPHHHQPTVKIQMKKNDKLHLEQIELVQAIIDESSRKFYGFDYSETN